VSDDEEVDVSEDEEEEETPKQEEKPPKEEKAPKPEKASKGGKAKDEIEEVFGKVGVKDIYDLFAFIAGILGAVVVLIDLIGIAQQVGNPLAAQYQNYWMIVFYILAIWVFVDAILATKLGPALSRFFKSQISSFSFLRDETDAKNFVVIIAAWTTVLLLVLSGNAHIGHQQQNWEIYLFLASLVLYGIYLLKGKLQKK
jgi:uncharacterized membrane protein